MKQIKRFLSGLLVLCLLVSMIPVTARAAESGTCGDDLTWTLSDDGILTISGTGMMDDFRYAPWYGRCNSIESVVIENGVTSIGDYAFTECEMLCDVTIPDSVTSIGDYVFSDCYALDDVTIPGSVTSMGDGVFSNCLSLTSVTIGNGVASIGDNAFQLCRALINITIPDSVTSIGDYAFRACYVLTELTIPDSVTSIGNGAFDNCMSLTSITIPENVTSIGKMPFNRCDSLTGIYVNENNPCYSSDSNGVLFNKAKTELIQAPGGYQGHYSIPDTVTSICEYAFSECSYLTGITIPTSVTSIGWYVFTSCKNLTSITIPTSVTSIDSTAFLGCRAVEDIFYGGTTDEWSVISSSCPNAAYIHYECTDSVTHWTVDAQEATCEEAGYSRTFCSCGYEKNNFTTEALGHSYEDGWCIRCSKNAPIAYGTCGDDLTWTLDDDGILVITGAGPMTDHASASEAPWYSHRASIRAIELEEGVTTVGDRAFYNCTALTDVSFSSTVSTIGTYAFRGCTALEAVTLPGTVTELKGSAFRACTALTTVTFGGNAPAVGNFVFNDGAESLTVRRYEGTTGFDIAPWTGFTMELLHVGQWIVDKEPTCTEEGSRHIDCAYCQETITETLTGGHNYVDGICTICQEAEIVDSGSCGGNLTWKLDTAGTLTISGTGAMPYYYPESDVPWYAQRLSIKTIILEEGVTRIGQYAFLGCSNLTSITIPDSVTEISYNALKGCSSLTSIVIPDSVTKIYDSAFSGCTGLASVTIGNGLTSIANSTFYGCSSLTSITIPDSVANIGAYAFYGCSGLTSVIIPDSVTSIGGSAFSRCNSLASVTIPDSVTTIGSGAFYSCSGLETISIGSGITTIDYSVFSGCSSLTSITIPDSVTSIGESAFENCASLTNVSIPDSVIQISNSAFSGCTSLAGITIPDSVTTIGRSVFYDCSSLASVTIGSGVTSMGGYVFEGCSSLESVTIKNGVTDLGTATFSGCSNLTSISIPGSVTSIDMNMFLGCTGLTSVSIGNGVTSIGNDAFYDCSSLASISIPDSVTSIGNEAFYGCTSLTSASIGNGVTTIGTKAFYECSSLISISIPDSVTSIGEKVFYGCTGLASASIGNGVTSIGSFAFYECTSLENISIGNSVTSIDDYAFYGCSSLTSVSIPDSVTTIDDYAFYKCSSLASASVGNGVTSIGSFAFYECSSLISISIPDSVTSIGDAAFYGCNSLECVSIGSGVTDIGYDCFRKCSSLTSVSIPDSVQSIGESAFHSCTMLKEVSIGDSVKAIEGYTFGTCKSLKYIVIPDSVEYIGTSAFSNCTELEQVVLGRNIKSIGRHIFISSNSLHSLVFRGDAPVIDSDAFLYKTATCYYPAFNDTWTADVMQNYGGTITWVSRYMDPVKILTQPEDFVGMVGEMASFTVETDRDDVTYQWYYSSDNGLTWEKSSCTADTLEVEFKAYRLGYLYCCEVTDSDGNTVASEAAVLAAQEMDLVIETQPVSYVGAVNDDVAFTVEATGNGLTYEWFFSTDGGETWEKSYSPGYMTNTLAPILRSHRDGNMYKCVVTDVFGNSVESDAVSMTVETGEIIIVTQPVGIENAVLSKLYGYSVVAEGVNLTYRWQLSTDGGETWEDSWNDGYNTPNLSVRMNANRDGYLYRCAITSGQKLTVYSDAVILDMQAPSVNLISQSGNVFVVAKETATFTVEAEGMDLTYLWYRSDDQGATWYQTYLDGYNTNTLSFMGLAGRAAMYMCKITDGSGKAIWSSPVKLQILSAELQILTQPESVTCADGEMAVFTVEAQGDGLKYQWQSSTDGVEWTPSFLDGYNTNTFYFSVIGNRATKMYRCVITDAAGNTVVTDVVSVTIG